MHDVDEDMRTIARCGGRWTSGEGVGITLRALAESSTAYIIDVASLKNKTSSPSTDC